MWSRIFVYTWGRVTNRTPRTGCGHLPGSASVWLCLTATSPAGMSLERAGTFLFEVHTAAQAHLPLCPWCQTHLRFRSRSCPDGVCSPLLGRGVCSQSAPPPHFVMKNLESPKLKEFYSKYPQAHHLNLPSGLAAPVLSCVCPSISHLVPFEAHTTHSSLWSDHVHDVNASVPAGSPTAPWPWCPVRWAVGSREHHADSTAFRVLTRLGEA